MKAITAYVAIDGTIFEKEEDCIFYEDRWGSPSPIMLDDGGQRIYTTLGAVYIYVDKDTVGTFILQCMEEETPYTGITKQSRGWYVWTCDNLSGYNGYLQIPPMVIDAIVTQANS